MTLPALLAKHRVARIDLLHIDTEGHDLQILRQVDFRAYKPRMIVVEHLHMTEDGKKEALGLLESQGYAVQVLTDDFAAVPPDPSFARLYRKHLRQART
jgi:hypothetical protein